MRQGRRSAGFVQKALAGGRARGNLGSDNLQRHATPQMGFLGIKNEAHSSFANQAAHAITAQPADLLLVHRWAEESEIHLLAACGATQRVRARCYDRGMHRIARQFLHHATAGVAVFQVLPQTLT